MIKIDHGVEINRAGMTEAGLTGYIYRYHDSLGYHVVRFQTNLKPEVGDFIDPELEILVKRVGLQINQDKRMWMPMQQVDVWGR